MQTYYSPSEDKFYKSNRKINDWVLADVSFDDTPWTVVSSQVVQDEFGNDRIEYSFSVDNGQKAADLSAKQAEIDAENSSKSLDMSLAIEALQAAQTTQVEAALLDIFTYQSMLAKPELYDGEGIVAKKATANFQVGDALNTTLKITNYATECLDEAEAYFVSRLKQVSTFIQGG